MNSHGRARRPDNAPTVLLQARVHPDARRTVQEAAERSGVSIAFYMNALIARLAEDPDGLPIIPPARAQQEELPIPAA